MVGLGAWLGWRLWPGRPAADPLPGADEVERVVATVRLRDGGERVRFEVPPDYWPRVRAALGPAAAEAMRRILIESARGKRAVWGKPTD